MSFESIRGHWTQSLSQKRFASGFFCAPAKGGGFAIYCSLPIDCPKEGGGNCIPPDSRRRTAPAPILLSVSPCWNSCRSMLISCSRRNLVHRRREDGLTIFLNRWEYTPVEARLYKSCSRFCMKADEPFRSSRRLSVADGWRVSGNRRDCEKGDDFVPVGYCERNRMQRAIRRSTGEYPARASFALVTPDLTSAREIETRRHKRRRVFCWAGS